jgi:hypothetical protein
VVRRLLREGLAFTRCCSQSRARTPSRASFLAGCCPAFETKGWKGGAPRTVQAGDKPLTAGKDFHGCVWDGVLLLQVLAVVRDDVKIAVLPKWPWKGIGRWHSEGLLRSWR